MAGILLVLCSSLVLLAFETGVTADEPSHLLSAFLYWHGQDRLSPGDVPPLIKIAGGWVPRILDLPVPDGKDEVWKSNSEWMIALKMMDGLNSGQILKIFPYSRLPLIVFPLGCCVLLWWWSRRLFSPLAGLIAAALFAASPTVLGHGALFKNDLAASFAYLFFWYRAWEFWRNPGARQPVWLGFALLLAMSAKYSLAILIPIAPAIVVLRCLSSRPIAWRPFVQALVPLVAIPLAGVALLWQFSFLTGIHSLWLSNSDPNRVYLAGKIFEGGHPLYFVAALLTKVPAATLILIGTGSAAYLAKFSRKAETQDFFWILPPVLYFVLASTSSLQLGFRLVLPSLTFLFMLAALGCHWSFRNRYTRLLAAPLLLWTGIRTAAAYPHYLSYFNSLAGGPDRGIEFLSDSNIDWGQDLRRLRAILDERAIPKIRLAYFGTDNPYAYFDDKRVESIVPPWSPELVAGKRFEPLPGYYAISATLLTGQLFAEPYRDYFAAFRPRQPVAKAGYSIFVYRID